MLAGFAKCLRFKGVPVPGGQGMRYDDAGGTPTWVAGFIQDSTTREQSELVTTLRALHTTLASQRRALQAIDSSRSPVST